MRAVVVDPEAPERLVIKEVADPQPQRNEALVRTAATTLNRGEVSYAVRQDAPAGHRPGWDIAGVVESAALDGTGPPVGARVVGILGSRGWAELAAVPTDSLAVLPETISFALGATLPMAGLTAMHALRRGQLFLGKSVLVTGATGGVGDYAVQLARIGGATVTAYLRDDRWAEFAGGSGADQVAVGPEIVAAARPYGPFDIVVETVGGRTLSGALSMLAREGIAVTLGYSSGEAITIEEGRRPLAAGTLIGLSVYHDMRWVEPASADLRRLCNFVQTGRLIPHIHREADWTEVNNVAGELLDRRYPGKAVLHISKLSR